MTITARQIADTLAGSDGFWDFAAIADDLTSYPGVDDVPEAIFWDAVAAHELPEPTPFADFVAALSARIASMPRSDRDAIWTDGTVTVRARGVSRVNQDLPQPTAEFDITTATAEFTLREIGWQELWTAVCEVREEAERSLDTARAGLCQTHIVLREAETAWRDARAARDAAIHAALTVGMSVADIADAAGLSAPAVYKIAGRG